MEQEFAMSLPLHAQTRPVPEAAVLEGLPPVREVSAAEVAARISGGPRLVVLDDDPTGTQTVADVPVLTSWTVDDLRWALRQDSAVFFVLTNTRSLSPEDAAARNREVVRALHTASAAEGTGYVLASRGDSTSPPTPCRLPAPRLTQRPNIVPATDRSRVGSVRGVGDARWTAKGA
jgi:hypothetical protein